MHVPLRLLCFAVFANSWRDGSESGFEACHFPTLNDHSRREKEAKEEKEEGAREAGSKQSVFHTCFYHVRT